MDFAKFSLKNTKMITQKSGMLGVSLQNVDMFIVIMRFLGVNTHILKKKTFCVLKAKRFRKICEIREKSVNSGFFLVGELLWYRAKKRSENHFWFFVVFRKTRVRIVLKCVFFIQKIGVSLRIINLLIQGGGARIYPYEHSSWERVSRRG